MLIQETLRCDRPSDAAIQGCAGFGVDTYLAAVSAPETVTEVPAASGANFGSISFSFVREAGYAERLAGPSAGELSAKAGA
jgi:hypothetical protein